VVTIAALVATGQLSNIARAVANFFVAESPKTVNLDPSTTANQTSQLTVKDDLAINGYTVQARLATDVSADFTVRISSAASALCPTADPCELTTADQYIHFNTTDSATSSNGDILNFAVDIYSNGSFSSQDVDIVYTKERSGFMQNFNTTACASMAIYPATNSERMLLDIRNDKFYNIRKLVDGKCWMVDNLALSGTATTPLVLNSDTSDLATGATYSLGAMPAASSAQTYCNNLNPAVYPHKCGNYYNWANSTAGSTISDGNAPNSVCPKNWRLPTSGEISTLNTGLGWGNAGANVINSAFRGLYAGYYSESNSFTAVGTDGDVRTATAVGGNGNTLLCRNGSVSIAAYMKTRHFSIRCVAR
jgi:uncharacterized protein (TIGR02145 family)